MLTGLIAQITTVGDRIDAVHKYFDSRQDSDGLNVVLGALMIAMVLCGLLTVLHRIQLAGRRREDRARAKRRESLSDKLRPAARISRDLTLIQKQQTARRTAARGPVAGARR